MADAAPDPLTTAEWKVMKIVWRLKSCSAPRRLPGGWGGVRLGADDGQDAPAEAGRQGAPGRHAGRVELPLQARAPGVEVALRRGRHAAGERAGGDGRATAGLHGQEEQAFPRRPRRTACPARPARRPCRGGVSHVDRRDAQRLGRPLGRLPREGDGGGEPPIRLPLARLAAPASAALGAPVARPLPAGPAEAGLPRADLAAGAAGGLLADPARLPFPPLGPRAHRGPAPPDGRPPRARAAHGPRNADPGGSPDDPDAGPPTGGRRRGSRPAADHATRARDGAGRGSGEPGLPARRRPDGRDAHAPGLDDPGEADAGLGGDRRGPPGAVRDQPGEDPPPDPRGPPPLRGRTGRGPGPARPRCGGTHAPALGDEPGADLARRGGTPAADGGDPARPGRGADAQPADLGPAARAGPRPAGRPVGRGLPAARPFGLLLPPGRLGVELDHRPAPRVCLRRRRPGGLEGLAARLRRGIPVDRRPFGRGGPPDRPGAGPVRVADVHPQPPRAHPRPPPQGPPGPVETRDHRPRGDRPGRPPLRPRPRRPARGRRRDGRRDPGQPARARLPPRRVRPSRRRSRSGKGCRGTSRRPSGRRRSAPTASAWRPPTKGGRTSPRRSRFGTWRPAPRP